MHLRVPVTSVLKRTRRYDHVVMAIFALHFMPVDNHWSSILRASDCGPITPVRSPAKREVRVAHWQATRECSAKHDGNAERPVHVKRSQITSETTMTDQRGAFSVYILNGNKYIQESALYGSLKRR